MSKNKKAKVIPFRATQLSAENYIKTQARLLPIYECLLTGGWQDTGICNVVVARRHKTGNITFGVYLVDLYCLGLKDALYEFNMAEFEYERYKEKDPGWEECDYVLAHNIIFGAIAYAEDYGFKPDPDFAVAQFILEEDDEDVELMEIEFGLDGKPCYMSGPFDDPVKIRNITNTLMRTAGKGNFTAVDSTDFDDEDDDWEGDDDLDGDLDEDEAEARLKTLIKTVDLAYDELIRTPEAKEAMKFKFIAAQYKITDDGVKHAGNTFKDENLEDGYRRLRDMIFEDDLKPAIKELRKLIKKHPDEPMLYNLLQTAYTYNGEFKEAALMIPEMYLLFPDYLFARVPFANFLIDAGKPEGVLEVFGGKPDLGYMYPDRKVFHVKEAAVYYACMCRYFVAVDNIDSADMYMNAIIENGLLDIPDQNIVEKAVIELFEAKMKKVKEVSELPDDRE